MTQTLTLSSDFIYIVELALHKMGMSLIPHMSGTAYLSISYIKHSIDRLFLYDYKIDLSV